MKFMSFGILSFCLIILSSCSGDPVASDGSVTYEKLGPEEFKAKLTANPDALLVDVRTPPEFAAGAIGNAVNIDYYHSDFKAQMEKLDNSKPLFLYCKSGGRSGKSAKICKSLGFTKIYDLKGGYTGWPK